MKKLELCFFSEIKNYKQCAKFILTNSDDKSLVSIDFVMSDSNYPAHEFSKTQLSLIRDWCDEVLNQEELK
jgi:hypothetical protein